MFILYRTGANGKSMFLNVIQNILGDYALSTWAETFMKRNNDTATSERRFGIRMKELGMVQKRTSEARFWQDLAVQA